MFVACCVRPCEENLPPIVGPSRTAALPHARFHDPALHFGPAARLQPLDRSRHKRPEYQSATSKKVWNFVRRDCTARWSSRRRAAGCVEELPILPLTVTVMFATV